MVIDGASSEIQKLTISPEGENKPLVVTPETSQAVSTVEQKPDLNKRLEQVRQEIQELEPNPDKEQPIHSEKQFSNILFIPKKTGLRAIWHIGEQVTSMPLRKASEFILKRAYKDFVSEDRIKKSAAKLTIVEGLDFISRFYKYSSGSKPKRVIEAIASSLTYSGIRRVKSQTVEVNGFMVEAPLGLIVLSPSLPALGLLSIGLVATLPVGMHEVIHDISASKDGKRRGLKVADDTDGKRKWKNNWFNELAVIDSMADRIQKAFKFPSILLGRLPSLFYPGPLAVFQWERMRRSLDKQFGKLHTKHLIDLALFYDDGLEMLQTSVDEIRGKGNFQKLSDRSTILGLTKGLWTDLKNKIAKAGKIEGNELTF